MKFQHWSTTAVFVLGLQFSNVNASTNDALDVPRAAHIPSRNTLNSLSDNLAPRFSSRPDVGTKDAPVDGADGKPHAGPFVESSGDSTVLTKVDSSAGNKDKQTPEDGVMNDPNRLVPKKGTTGTEGGVSEKDRLRQADEAETGQRRLKKPESPKEIPSKPVTDRLDVNTADDTGNPKAPVSKNAEKANTKADKARGAAGIEKPKDLGEKPHNVPHPDPPSRKPHEKEFEHSKKTSHPKHYDSDAVSDEDDHGIIPWDALAGSFGSIAATEIGDKTFIVAALMAMRHPRLQVFTAAFSALFVMTILSGFAGHAIGAIISKKWSALLAAILFLGFGGKSLKEGLDMSPDAGTNDEMREVQAELEEKEADIARQEDNRHRRVSSISPYALESGRLGRRSASHSPSGSPQRRSVSYTLAGVKNLLGLVLSPAWVETFSMTFVGELGDRSQIATVAMAAGQEYFWIIVGATLGHFVCTGVAVIGGSVLAGRVSMRKVTLVGGGIFIVFGILTFIEFLEQWR